MSQIIKRLVVAALAVRAGSTGFAFRFVIGYLDMIIVPWIVASETVFIYVFARVVSLCVPGALSCLEARAAPRLQVLFHQAKPVSFQAAAARVNLGYLLICGAVGLIVVCCAPYVSAALKLGGGNFVIILQWLILGQCAPMLFGATGLLMRIIERGTFYDMLQGLTTGFFLVSITGINASSAEMVAQTFAVSQLTLSAVCAFLLTRNGIWPGLTVLLHKEITLF